MLDDVNKLHQFMSDNGWDALVVRETNPVTPEGVPIKAGKLYQMFDQDQLFIPEGSPALAGVQKIDQAAVASGGMETRFFEVTDPLLWKGLQQLGPQDISLLAKTLGAPASALRAGVTGSMEFVAKNVPRDLAMAWVNAGINPMAFVHGVASLIKKDDLYSMWLESGATRAAISSMDRRVVHNLMTEVEGKGGLGNVILHPLQGFIALSEAMENSTRIGAFRWRLNQLTEAGMPLDQAIKEAAVVARNGTVDFQSVGASQLVANFRVMTAFWGAAMSSADNVVRAVADDPTGWLTRATVGITAPSVALYMINRRDPDYTRLSDAERDLFWHIKRPKNLLGQALGEDVADPSDDIWLRWPKPFEPGMMAGSMVERFLQAVDQEDPAALDEAAERMLLSTSGAYVPLPSSLSPLYENLVNRSRLSGAPIVPDGMREIDPTYQATKRTSDLAKGLARMYNQGIMDPDSKIAPAQIDNVLRGYTGSLGRFFYQDAPEAIARGVEFLQGSRDAKNGPAPAQEMMEMLPGVRAFVSSFPENGRPIADIYKLVERAKSAQATATQLEATLQVDDYVDWVTQRAVLLGLAEHLKPITADLAEMRMARDQVEAGPGTPGEKRRAIYEIQHAMMIKAEGVLNALRKSTGIRPNPTSMPFVSASTPRQAVGSTTPPGR